MYLLIVLLFALWGSLAIVTGLIAPWRRLALVFGAGFPLVFWATLPLRRSGDSRLVDAMRDEGMFALGAVICWTTVWAVASALRCGIVLSEKARYEQRVGTGEPGNSGNAAEWRSAGSNPTLLALLGRRSSPAYSADESRPAPGRTRTFVGKAAASLATIDCHLKELSGIRISRPRRSSSAWVFCIEGAG